MPLSEKEIITRFFTRAVQREQANALGVGDDAAVLTVPPGYALVTSVDTSVAGVHFPLHTDPFDIGAKSLAVSVSDIAAMGAEPTSALLALTLPEQTPDWLSRFSAGFFSVAEAAGLDLVGGDLSRGPLSITTVVNGLVPTGQALRRSGAQVGDRLYITGTLGDAARALQLVFAGVSPVPPVLLARLNRPTPRVTEGIALRAVATSAMDVSDGLMIDLERLCQQSGVAARVATKCLPFSDALLAVSTLEQATLCALTGGDDYELLFTVPPTIKIPARVNATCIGEIVAGSGVVAYDAKGNALSLERHGYDHFKGV